VIDVQRILADYFGAAVGQPEILYQLSIAVPALLPFVFVAGVVRSRLAQARVGEDNRGARRRRRDRERARTAGRGARRSNRRDRRRPGGGRPRARAGRDAGPARGGPPGLAAPRPRLDEDPELLDAAAAAAAGALARIEERERGAAELLRARQRAAEPRTWTPRVERDLHDGAQQASSRSRIELDGARERLGGRLDPEVAALLARATDRLATAVAELRGLAHGSYPGRSSKAASMPRSRRCLERVPDRVTLRGAIAHRLDPALEATAYFVATEALTNALKHGAGDRDRDPRLPDSGRRLCVRGARRRSRRRRRERCGPARLANA